jgi:hypothetical protein
MVGLLLLEAALDGVKCWQRIGICVWQTSHLANIIYKAPQKALLEGESAD